MRTLVLTLLAGLLSFAVGSWQQSSGKLGSQPVPAPPMASAPSAAGTSPASAPPTVTAGAPADTVKSLRERLKELARSRNPLVAAAEAQVLIAKLTLEDFRELASQPKEFPFPNPSMPGDGALFSRAYLDALVRRWLEVDPEGGAAAMRAVEDGLLLKREGKSAGYGAGHGMLAVALGRLRPGDSSAFCEELASGAREWKTNSMEASKAFENLARVDSARATALAERITDKMGQIMARGAIATGSIRETDPVEVSRVSRNSRTTSDAFEAAARQGPEKLRAALEATSWSKSINSTAIVAEGVIRDPDGAWDTIPGELAGKPDGNLSAGSARTAQMLARELSPADRERALATAERLPAAWKAGTLQPLVAAWALSEPQAALEWVAQKSDRADGALAAFGPWIVNAPEAALAWTEGSAPPALRQALSAQLARIFETGESERQRPHNGPTLNRAPAEERATAEALLQHSPAAAARIVAELPTAQVSGMAFRPIFEKWLDRDAPAAAQWLEALPASRRRDEAVAAFATVAAARDAEGAAQWVPTIADQKLREQTAESVFRAMELRDPPAAQAWRASILPPP